VQEEIAQDSIRIKQRAYQTAAERWAGVGPYYAMFPIAFANDVILEHTRPGDTVFDPFAGRGTTVFSAAANGRYGVGVELNPVGWVYSQAKLKPASYEAVWHRLGEINSVSRRDRDTADDLPQFFHHCFNRRVLQFLVAARAELNWRQRPVDWTTMALLLVHLHGRLPDALSNQMRQTKSMSPDYAIRWWQERSLLPPDLNPVEFIRRKLKWRYAKGRPQTGPSHVYLGDSVKRLPQLAQRLRKGRLNHARLLLTSPPYFGLADYHYDQWLRLWLLGGPSEARRSKEKHRGKFEHPEHYQQLLTKVFASSSLLLHEEAVIYVRTGKQSFTYETTKQALFQAFPNKQLCEYSRPYSRPTQTALFGDHDPKDGEVDLILLPK